MREECIELFKPLAEYVAIYETSTLSYEMLQSDKDPLVVYILERYIDKKSAFEGIHRNSEEFKFFRGKLAAMQVDRGVVVKGESFMESGIGFI